ncbi:MAG: hypothetical protein DRP93_06290 [Candidatus Neomarinimicrobiota bacterium]|nr:MAG: hypothetical protein DRP93_06290 [Candidatus Neomarinimicrobiota bacterium]
MQITLNIKETVVDEFMQLLKQFSKDEIIIEDQAFIEEKSRLQQELNSIDAGATMVSDKDLWASTENTIDNQQ